jgi:hypothetical protein
VSAESAEQKTRLIIGEGDEATGIWRTCNCAELNLTATELAILCSCWYVRRTTIADATSYIPPELFKFQEDLLIPAERRRERIQIKNPLSILQNPIEILTKEEFLKDPKQHQQFQIQAEKDYLRACCEKTTKTGLPALYRIKDVHSFQLFSSIIWACYAAKIESNEIQEEPDENLPEEIVNAQTGYRQNFHLSPHRSIPQRQINNEARKVLLAIRDETADLLPSPDKERWLAKSEQQVNDDVFQTRQAVLKGYIAKEDQDQLQELADAQRRVEENNRKKKIKPDPYDDMDTGEIPDEKWG